MNIYSSVGMILIARLMEQLDTNTLYVTDSELYSAEGIVSMYYDVAMSRTVITYRKQELTPDLEG